jgi:hypothetical protein
MPAAPPGRAAPPYGGAAGRPCPHHATRRGFLLGSATLAGSMLLTRSAGRITTAKADVPGWDDNAYWAFADRLQDRLDEHWDERRGAYIPARAMLNAGLLLTHAAAALAGHTGPSRRDDRARRLVDELCTAAWTERPAGGSQGHAPGWRDSLEGGGFQHLVVDTEIAWALAVAWQARTALGLEAASADRIADRITRCAAGSFWRWPALRLNQINWYARMYVASATVGGPATALHGELLHQVNRFVDGATRPMPGAEVSNLGGGYRFHYLPQAPARHKYNLDTAEYANIVCGFLVPYEQARAAGMAALDRERASVVHAWVERVLSGYWTHAGYVNWDTGLGFKRWHQGKKFGLSQAALLGIATCAELRPDASYGAWAKHFLDSGFELFDRWTARTRGLPPANAFSVPSIDANEDSAVLAAGRIQANAAQAALLGLGRARSIEPPPLYAFDPDVGRLAVTTPAYNTAIVAVNRGAFPYGGIELARLFDGSQDVAAGVGGRPPASFGVVVRDAAGKMAAATQQALDPDAAGDPLQLLEAPRGTGSDPAPFPARPYAGPFKELRARGSVTRGGIRLTTTHRFTATFVETEWDVAGAGGGGHTTDVLFPSWGAGARAWAVSAGGARRALGTAKLADVAWLHVESELSGYVVVPVAGRAGATARTQHVATQTSAPKAGPTLAIRLPHGTTKFSARIAPARSVEEARTVAEALRG